MDKVSYPIPDEMMHSEIGHFLTELKGNILYPLMGANPLMHGDAKAYGVVKREWLCLKLNLPYGRFQKQFGQVLSNRSIKKFRPISRAFMARKSLAQARPLFCLSPKGISWKHYP